MKKLCDQCTTECLLIKGCPNNKTMQTPTQEITPGIKEQFYETMNRYSLWDNLNNCTMDPLFYTYQMGYNARNERMVDLEDQLTICKTSREFNRERVVGLEKTLKKILSSPYVTIRSDDLLTEAQNALTKKS